MVNIPLISKDWKNKKQQEQEITPEEEEMYKNGYESGLADSDEELSVQDQPSARDMTQFWSATSRPTDISKTRMQKKVVPNMGTTFYPRSFNPDEELQHALNRIIYLKISILGDWEDEEDKENEIQNKGYAPWFRSNWYKWEAGNEIFEENIADQMVKVDVDALSRRSVDGLFLKEVNASRKYIERKKEGDKIAGAMMQG